MDVPNGGKTEMPKDKVALEQQYVLLLEQRIAQLESAIARPVSETPAHTQKTSEDDTKPAEAGADAADDNKTGTASDDKEDGAKRKEDDEGNSKDTEQKGKEGNDKDKDQDKPQERVRYVVATVSEDTYEFKDEDVDDTKIFNDTKTNDDRKGAGSAEKGKRGQEPTICRRVMQEDNPKKVDFDQIEIVSPELKRIYYEITAAPSKIDDSWIESGTLTLVTPFKELMWRWEKFEGASKPVDNDTEERALAREDLKKILAFVRKTTMEPYFKARETSLTKGNVPFEHLWTLYPPGAKVCAKTFMDDVQILEVRSCTTPDTFKVKNNSEDFRVYCIGIDWDGNKFSAFEYTFLIQKSTDQSEPQIVALDVYPLRLHRNPEGLQEELIKRGEKFWSTCMPEKFQYDYSGPVLAIKPSQSAMAQMLADQGKDSDTMSSFSTVEDGLPTSSRKEFSGQIIVDAFSYLRAPDDISASYQEPPLGDLAVEPYSESECTCKACMESPIVQWQKKFFSMTSTTRQYELFAKNDDKHCRDRLMMCPPRVLGYALKGKMWAQFRITSCKPVPIDDGERRNYFKEQLQLDEHYKTMLMAFVNNHRASSRSSEPANRTDKKQSVPRSLDVIEGKGKGLAILLHGPPGVGKTLTAETIALATGRPLLVVSVAEIGTKAANAESRLNVYFAIAARWGAILLIDEADVFLEERVRTDNPERNMLVSVLLRSLEYYEGIIFLTTNRIRAIDVAVQSRMHLAIQYRKLKPDHKIAIYRNLLDKVPDSQIQGPRLKLYKMINDQLCRRGEMNGRQIRNIVSAALALAKDRGANDGDDTKLIFEDLREVHEATTDFLESLKDTTMMARQRNEAAADDD